MSLAPQGLSPGVALVQRVAEVREADLAEALNKCKESKSFTDLDLFCSGGVRVSAHRSVLGPLSPWLERTLANLDCCHCQTKTCAGGSGGGRVALTLSEVRSEWLMAAMDVVYTGKAALNGAEEMERVAEVLDMLGININKEHLTLEDDHGVEENVDKAKEARESSDTPTWASAVIKEELKRTGGTTKFLPFEEEQELLALVNSPTATKRKGGRKRTRKSVEAEDQLSHPTEEIEGNNRRPARAAKRGRKVIEKEEQEMDWVEDAIDSIVSDVTDRAESSDAGVDNSSGINKSPKTLSRRSRQRLSACQMTPEEASEAVAAYRASRSRGHPFSCHLCGIRALNMGELTQHTCSAHYSAAVDKDILQESTVADCSVCMYIPPGQHGKLFAHVATVHGLHRDVVPSELADFLFGQSGQKAKHTKAKPIAATSSRKTAATSAVSVKADPPSPAQMGPGDVATLKDVPPPSSGVLACFFCGAGIFQSRAQLKQHMMHHYRQVIRNTYFPASRTGVRHGSEISTECPIQGCSYKASFKSNRLEHLTMHIGLTHRKIMDYMPEEEGGRVFGTNRRKSTLFFDPEDDDTSVTKSPANNLPNGHNSTAADKKTKEEDTTTTTDPECPMPGCSQLVQASKLRGHMLTHFQGEVKGAMFAEAKWGVCSDTKACPLCQWDGAEIAHLVMHMGIKHDLLEKVMPDGLVKTMEDLLKSEAEKIESQESEEEATKDEKDSKEEEEQKSNATPEKIQEKTKDNESSPEKEKNEKSAADTNGTKDTEAVTVSPGAKMKPEDKDVEQSASVKCHLCNFSFDTFVSFKLHLARLHFSASLRRDLAPTLSAAGAEAATSASKKWRCDANSGTDSGEKCGALLGGEPALMHHLAVQHDRVMEYLGADDRERVKQGFGIENS